VIVCKIKLNLHLTNNKYLIRIYISLSHRLAIPTHPLFLVSMVTEVKEQNPNKQDVASLRQQGGETP